MLTLHRGVVLSPAVIPIILTIWWSKLTRAGLLCGSIFGAILGMLAWMVGCWKIFGKFFVLSAKIRPMICYFSGTINIPNLALPESAVCSGLTGLLSSGLIAVFVSLLSKRLVNLYLVWLMMTPVRT